MRDFLEAFRVHLAATSKRPATIATYVSLVETFFASAGPSRPPDRSDVEAFLARPRGDGQPRAAGTRNQALAALRAAATVGVRDFGWSADPTAGIAFAKEARRDPAFLDAGELRRLFVIAGERAADDVARSRDLAIVALLSQVGLRVHELVSLDVDQIDIASATVLSVAGKGGTSAALPLNAAALSLVVAWLAARRHVAHGGDRALFVSRRGTRISKRAVQHLIARLRDAMETRKKVSCHALRHSCATLALTVGGADLSTVAELLRHSDLNTTRKYLHLIDTRRRDAVRRLAATIPAEVLPSPFASLAPDDLQMLDGHAFFGEAANNAKNLVVVEDDLHDASGDRRDPGEAA